MPTLILPAGNHAVGMIKPSWFYLPTFRGLSRLVGPQINLPGGPLNLPTGQQLGIGNFAIHPNLPPESMLQFYIAHVRANREWVPGHIDYMTGGHSNPAYPAGPVVSFLITSPNGVRTFGDDDINALVRRVVGPTYAAANPDLIATQRYASSAEVNDSVRGDFWNSVCLPFVFGETGMVPRLNYVHCTAKTDEEIGRGILQAGEFANEFSVLYGNLEDGRTSVYFEPDLASGLVNVLDKWGRPLTSFSLNAETGVAESASIIASLRRHGGHQLAALDFSQSVVEVLLRDMRQFYLYQQAEAAGGVKNNLFERKYENPGRIFVVVGPSGVGKTELVKAVLNDNPDIKPMTLYTDKPAKDRDLYQAGVSTAGFEARIGGKFCAFESGYGNWYGVTRDEVELAVLRGGRSVLIGGAEVAAKLARYVFELTGRTDLVVPVVLDTDDQVIADRDAYRQRQTGRAVRLAAVKEARQTIQDVLTNAGLADLIRNVKNNSTIASGAGALASALNDSGIPQVSPASLLVLPELELSRLNWLVSANMAKLVQLCETGQPDNFNQKAAPLFESLLYDLYRVVNGYYPSPGDRRAINFTPAPGKRPSGHMNGYLVNHLLAVAGEVANLRGLDRVNPKSLPGTAGYVGLRAALNFSGPFAEKICAENLAALQEIAALPKEELLAAAVGHDFGKLANVSSVYHNFVSDFLGRKFPSVVLQRLNEKERKEIETAARKQIESDAKAAVFDTDEAKIAHIEKETEKLMRTRIKSAEAARNRMFIPIFLRYHHALGDLFQGRFGLVAVAEMLEDNEVKNILLDDKRNPAAVMTRLLAITALDTGSIGTLHALTFNGMVQVKNALVRHLEGIYNLNVAERETAYQTLITDLKNGNLGGSYNQESRFGSMVSFLLQPRELYSESDLAGIYRRYAQPVLDADGTGLAPFMADNKPVISLIDLPYFRFDLTGRVTDRRSAHKVNPALFQLFRVLADRYAQDAIPAGKPMEVLMVDSNYQVPERDHIPEAYRHLRESSQLGGNGTGTFQIIRATGNIHAGLETRFGATVNLPDRARYLLVLDRAFSNPGPETAAP